MISTNITDALTEFDTAEADATGYSTPGYQAKFHEAMESKGHSVGVPDPLSVAAPDNEFFVVQRADGSQAYTRAGNFQVQNGRLLAANGDQVMGYPAGRGSGSLSPITVPRGTPDGWVNISSNGTVSVADPKYVEKLDYAGHLDNTNTPLRGVTLPGNVENDIHPQLRERLASNGAVTNSVGVDGLASAPSLDGSTPASGGYRARPQPGTQPALLSPALASGMPAGTTYTGAGDEAADNAADAAAGLPQDPTLRNARNLAQTHDLGVHLKPGLVSGEARGSHAPAMGTPVGRLVLANFAAGTTIDSRGNSSSGAPLTIHMPESATCAAIKTNSRDLGNVAITAAVTHISDAGSRLSAIMADEQSRQSRSKKAMDLIK